jgi:hypothetical protein
MSCSEKILASLEDLLAQPFMAITSGEPVYEIDSRLGPEGYSQMIAWLQLDNVRHDVIETFNRDYNSLSDPFTEWAKAQSLVSSQILGGDNSTLVFEITAICC